MLYLPKQKIQRPKKLNPQDESLALKFLSIKRGRGNYGGSKDLGKIAKQFAPNAKDNKSAQLQNLKEKWREIMGENIAKLSFPDAITGKTLHLKVVGAASPLLQMRSKEILGMASLAIGIELTKLNMVQTKLPKQEQKKAKLKPLDAHESAKIEETINHIDNEHLKNTIRMLNCYIQNLP